MINRIVNGIASWFRKKAQRKEHIKSVARELKETFARMNEIVAEAALIGKELAEHNVAVQSMEVPKDLDHESFALLNFDINIGRKKMSTLRAQMYKLHAEQACLGIKHQILTNELYELEND